LAAFTIAEVLVIIAIMGLLTGLLLPALSAARTASRQMQCQTNLRQMSIAATHSTALWDAYPTAVRFEDRDGAICRVAWDWVTTITGDLVEPGPLWTFTDNPGCVMQCPGFSGSSNYSGDPYTGYNYNTSYVGAEYIMGPVVDGKITNIPVQAGAKPAAVRDPQHTAVFGVGGYSGGANKFMRAPEHPHGTSPWTTYAGGQAFLYNGQTNVAWADAHISAVNAGYEGMYASPALLNILRYPHNGFLSNDDSAYDLN
jgi:prepilin-type processing-associated H-X9-DG protein